MAHSAVAQLFFDFDIAKVPNTSKVSTVDVAATGGNRRNAQDEAVFSSPAEQCANEGHEASSLTRGVIGKEKLRAHAILDAIRLVERLDEQQREASEVERDILRSFGGFGAVALRMFPDPVKGQYKDKDWQKLGEDLQGLLSPEDYRSAKRTTFSAFYTSPQVMTTIHRAIARLGVTEDALVLEPGCGIGNFIGVAPEAMRFVGVELDRTSARIAKALYPQHDIRHESFEDTQLVEGSIDAAIGNVPFGDLKLKYKGHKLALHDYFLAKSVDTLRVGGVLGFVVSHYTLDKRDSFLRQYLGERADFLGAIRLPADAFSQEGTHVITDLVFLRKRDAECKPNHVDYNWLNTQPLDIDGTEFDVNGYFLNHPQMVLGTWSLKNRLYDSTYGLNSNGDLTKQLADAIEKLPESDSVEPTVELAPLPTPDQFERPPPAKHITTGSFFVGDDGVIYQVTSDDGASEPVRHGQRRLRANGTKLGRRVAALIKLRDAARRVLLSQNEGWPDAEREAMRKELNWVYDRFELNYGPINKTTFSQTKSGTTVRRMPNIAKFREDPDAMLVMSLEEYDEGSGKASKAAIMREDVVGVREEITTVTSAEEGLLVSLDETGGVDIDFIAKLYGKDQHAVVQELGDLVFQNPATAEFETADVYLSGNVRQKLATAEAGGEEFQPHVNALRAVQPPDVLPGDIDASLGSPWIPTKEIGAFAAELFGTPRDSIRIGHLQREAVWSVSADLQAERSVAATSEYGTARARGTWLLDLSLNQKSPTIYDTIRGPDGDQRVVNEDETLAAREKQKKVKEKFRAWIFTDPDRTERLVRIYNDTYNNLRLRKFNGAHLVFPGLNQTISLRPHQKDAIWRAMSSGNTLLAHAVGAGKTYVMAATGMKLRQAGLAKKPMFVVPNHMLEQFSREFMQLYPNAQLLIATKEDMRRDRRKFLTAKVASGNWDGIIVTHSSFERIAMSREYQERFLRGQIAEYEALIVEAAAEKLGDYHRNLIKTIEKQKAHRESRLEELMAEDKKDDGLTFDELGVDHLFIDEAHYFKNLETATKLQRVAGIQTGGSQRALDLYMKSKYLDELHAGHGLTFATGTPISNTMVEMYTVQRFLDLKGLRERGIEHFDAWAATFGEVVETMEISPDGKSMRPRARFARFNNLPELQQMFRSFTDVQTAKMLQLPTPKLLGGKPTVVACPMSSDQEYLQGQLVERYDNIRNSKIDPRVDNALAITTDGRKLALDAQMLAGDVKDFADGKINAMVRNIARVYHATTENRSTQLVFCDLGVKPTPWGYSVYETVIDKLVAHGIPSKEIATMHEAQTDAKKQALFDRVRSGSVRILIGSTQKMGTGTNVQKRLIAMHHLDAPWKPAEVEQRDGRILRQGNENQEVEIFRYVTEGSFDSFIWQALETKAKFIGQVMTGSTAVRRAHDIGGQELSYAEVKAIASGNPAVLTLAEADTEVKRLAILKKNHADEQFLARRNLKVLPQKIEEFSSRIDALTEDQATITRHEHARTEIAGTAIPEQDVVDILASTMRRLPQHVLSHRRDELGKFRGLDFGIIRSALGRPQVYLEGEAYRAADLSRENAGARAVSNGLERMANSYDTTLAKWQEDLAIAKQQLEDYRSRLGEVFPHEEYVDTLTSLRDSLRAALSGMADLDDDEEECSIANIAEETATLLASSKVADTAALRKKEVVSVTEAEPVTARVLQRVGRTIDIVDLEKNDSSVVQKNEEVLVEATPYDPADTWSETTLPIRILTDSSTIAGWESSEMPQQIQRQLF